MRFKLDENLPTSAAHVLTSEGHNVETAAEESLEGAVDSAIFAACQEEGRVLVTLDTDFADIRAYPPGTHQGVMVLRPGRDAIPLVLEALRRAVSLLTTEPISGGLWIVEASRVRIRVP